MTTDTLTTCLAWYILGLAVYACWRGLCWIGRFLADLAQPGPRRRGRRRHDDAPPFPFHYWDSRDD